VAHIVFTSHLQSFVPCAAQDVSGETVGAALARIFETNERLRAYVLDDQGRLRKHVFVFVDGRRARLEDAIGPSTEIHVLQALTGG
jgi:hypothetical protein